MPPAPILPLEEHGPLLTSGRSTHRAAIATARANGWMDANGLGSAARTLGHLGVFVGLELLVRALGGGWWRVLVLPAQIFVVAGFYSAMHEATHRNMFRRRASNRVAAFFWGSLLGANAAWYREMHFFHHAWARVEGGATAPNHASMWAMIRDIPMTGIEFITMTFRGTFGPIVGLYPPYSVPSRRTQLRREACLTVVVLALELFLVLWLPAVRTGWLVPLVGFYLVGYAYVSWPEHLGLGYRDDPLMSARTIRMPAVMRYVYWNNNYHAAHHLTPTVTWDNLPAFTATLPPHPTTTTGVFHIQLVRDMLEGRMPSVPDHDAAPDEVPVAYGPMVRGKSAVATAD